jgi:hypothetical protein
MNVKSVRDRAHHYLSDEVASCACMTLAELQQFVAGTVSLSEEQLECLARRMGMK